MPIAYALAADHLTGSTGWSSRAPLPGVSPPPPLFLPRCSTPGSGIWLTLPVINEQLVTGREDIFFGAEFDASAGTQAARRRGTYTSTPDRS